MPIGPDDAASLAKGVRELFNDAEGLLLQRIAAALAKGADSPDWAEQKLLSIRAVQQQVDSILADLNRGVPGAVDRAVNLAYNRGIAVAGGELTAGGLAAGAFNEIQSTGAIAAIVNDTLTRTQPMIFQIRRATTDLYQQVVASSAAQVNAGLLTRREASRQALTKLVQNGVTGFRDRAGRRWDMASYAEMSMRTSAAQASLQGHTDRLAELGVDTVQISDAPEECEICRPFEGKVLSISGRTVGDRLSDGTRVTGSLRDAKSKGLFHANCRHSQGVYIPGVTKRHRDTADPEGDQLRQQQRAYERRVRELKRADIIAQEYGGADATVARAKLRAKQAEFRDWREANDRKNLAYRTSLTAR